MTLGPCAHCRSNMRMLGSEYCYGCRPYLSESDTLCETTEDQ